MSRDTDWAALYGDDPEDDSGGRSRPPIWVVVVVVVSVVAGGWLLVTQGSTDGDADASPTIPPGTTDEVPVVTTTTASVAVTATTATSATTANGGPEFFDGSVYELVETDLNWESASAAAGTMAAPGCGSAHLATITSPEEQAVLTALMAESPGRAWLGGFQPPDELSLDQGWQWTTGELWVYTNWNDGEPNDDPFGTLTRGSEQHLVTLPESGTWNDAPDVEKKLFVVESEDCDVFGNPTAAVTAGSSQQLRGYVAVASPDASSSQDTVWVFRPGGSLVSRGYNSIRTDNGGQGWPAEYPLLITAGHLIVRNQIFDIDLAEPPISLWTDASVYPGSGPGVVWLARRQDSSRFSVSEWVAQVDVESLTVGEQVTDVSFYPIVGVADGLIVHDLPDDSPQFWSPTDGLVGVDIPNEPGVVVAASGNVVVVKTSGGVNVLDIVSGEQVVSLLVDFGVPVRSACLSPDRQHVFVVDFNGDAAVGNTATGEVISLNDDGVSVQPEHGIGWTTDDQLVFIEEIPEGEAKHIFGFDIATGERFVVAQLDGPEEWWLTASGAMC